MTNTRVVAVFVMVVLLLFVNQNALIAYFTTYLQCIYWKINILEDFAQVCYIYVVMLVAGCCVLWLCVGECSWCI